MNIFKNRKFFFIGGLFFCILLFLTKAGFDKHLAVENNTVVFGSEGFKPAVLEIKQGEKVKFITNIDKKFWPASDQHPSHGLYPEFDSKKPVSKNEPWSFNFDKPGVWSYHDHLFPSVRGKIIVLSPNQKFSEIDCDNPKNKIICWDSQIEKTLDSGGLEKTLSLVVELYANEPDFAADCHGFLHKLGEKTYVEYIRKKAITLNPATAFCGYGFYHGFMEKLFLSGGSFLEAGEFCRLVAEKNSVSMADACLHGVGHGAQAIVVSDPEVWGKPYEMSGRALLSCEKVSKDPIMFSRCASGVFMEFFINLAQEEYGLNSSTVEPINFCEKQSENSKMDCFTQMYPILKKVFRGDLKEAGRYIEKIPQNNFAAEAMQTLSGSFGDISKKDYIRNVKICSSFQARLQSPCILGIAEGILLNGKPGLEHLNAIEFCQSLKVNFKLTKDCFGFVLKYSKMSYEPLRFKEVCALIEKKYQEDFCK